MSLIHPRFYEGQVPLPVPLDSRENLDWYEEQIDRCFNGFTAHGLHITGDHYFLLNFFPMQAAILNKRGKPTGQFELKFGYFSQEDDYFYKQVEEARQSEMDIALMTGRGYGKTYCVLAIGAKIYVFKPQGAHLVISASIADHADPTFEKMREGLNGLEKIHPTLAQKRTRDSATEIKAGEKLIIEGREETVGSNNYIEKIVYAEKPGKTKGRRLDWQQDEEVGDWTGAAGLIDCISASRGTFYVGSIKKGMCFYTGTGGTIKSLEAKKIFTSPGTYNIYGVRQYADRPHAIFMPAYKKYGGYWEKDGVSDEAGAKAHLEAERKKMEGDPKAYSKFCQEYPFTIDEMFQLDGSNNFDQHILNMRIAYLESLDKQPGEWGNLHWRRKGGKIIGVEWEKDPNGKIWIFEKPELTPEGKPYSKLYVGGYDGIDLGGEDTASGLGSDGCLVIKKRMLSASRLHNAYVCVYRDRPMKIEEFYDNCFKIMTWYGAITNIEFSKTSILGFLKQRPTGLNYLMKRPKLTLNDITSERESNLYGTTATQKNFEFGEMYLAQHILDYSEHLMHLPMLQELRDFRMHQRTYFDLAVACMMAELADDEYGSMKVPVEKPLQKAILYGYYTDSNGRRRFGALNQQQDEKQKQLFGINNPIDGINIIG